MNKVALYFLQLFVLSIPLESAIVIAGFGTISRLLGTIVLTLVLALVLAGARPRRLLPAHFLLIAFVIWAGLSYFWSLDSGLTLSRFFTYIQLAAMVWVIWQIAQHPHDQFRIMKAYILGAYVASIYTVANFLAGTGPYASVSRYVAFGYDPNDLAVTLALGIPLSWYLALSQKKGILFWVYITFVPVAWVAIILTSSRGGFLSALTATSIVFFVGYQSRVTLLRGIYAALICVALGLAALLILSPEASYARLETIPNELLRGGDFTKRLQIWESSVDVFIERPIIGIGAGAFGTAILSAYGIYKVSHNAFLSLLVELGIIGFSLFAGAIIMLFILAKHMSKAQRRLWAVLISSWVVGAFVLTWEYRKPTWLLLGMLAAQVGTFMQRGIRRRTSFGSYRNGVNLSYHLYVPKNPKTKSLTVIDISTSNETERNNSC